MFFKSRLKVVLGWFREVRYGSFEFACILNMCAGGRGSRRSGDRSSRLYGDVVVEKKYL